MLTSLAGLNWLCCKASPCYWALPHIGYVSLGKWTIWVDFESWDFGIVKITEDTWNKVFCPRRKGRYCFLNYVGEKHPRLFPKVRKSWSGVECWGGLPGEGFLYLPVMLSIDSMNHRPLHADCGAEWHSMTPPPPFSLFWATLTCLSHLEAVKPETSSETQGNWLKVTELEQPRFRLSCTWLQSSGRPQKRHVLNA